MLKFLIFVVCQMPVLLNYQTLTYVANGDTNILLLVL